MAATRTELETDRERDLRAAERSRCRRAIEEHGFGAALMHGDCPE